MINLNESTFFFIIILTGIFTYIFFVNYQSCDIKCNIKFYKYENHFKNENENNAETKNLNNDDIFMDNNNINYTDDEVYLNNLLKPNIYV
tara:strand:- start:80 stop:349 length:270 start_codon:yes stop_codon:yes gene_type:complete